MGTSVSTQVSELWDLIAQLTPRDGVHQTAVASLRLMRYSFSSLPLSGVLSPTLCICAQGQKELLLGNEEVYSYSTGQHFVTSFELPLSARVLRATRAKPDLGLALQFNLASVRALIKRRGCRPPPMVRASAGFTWLPLRP